MDGGVAMPALPTLIPDIIKALLQAPGLFKWTSSIADTTSTAKSITAPPEESITTEEKINLKSRFPKIMKTSVKV